MLFYFFGSPSLKSFWLKSMLIDFPFWFRAEAVTVVLQATQDIQI